MVAAAFVLVAENREHNQSSVAAMLNFESYIPWEDSLKLRIRRIRGWYMGHSRFGFAD